MQTAWSRTWTSVVVSISSDNNHYTISVFTSFPYYLQLAVKIYTSDSKNFENLETPKSLISHFI